TSSGRRNERSTNQVTKRVKRGDALCSDMRGAGSYSVERGQPTRQGSRVVSPKGVGQTLLSCSSAGQTPIEQRVAQHANARATSCSCASCCTTVENPLGIRQGPLY